MHHRVTVECRKITRKLLFYVSYLDECWIGTSAVKMYPGVLLYILFRHAAPLGLFYLNILCGLNVHILFYIRL